jgi:ABC-2 type transport system permease protein
MTTVVAQPIKHWGSNYAWLVKREFWEHRALYLAPLVYAALIVLFTLLAVFGLGKFTLDGLSFGEGFDPAAAQAEARGGARLMVYAIFAAPFALIALFVTLYYSLDALYADRRDRSILFWKSMPLSDMESVLAKLSVAAFFGPAVAVLLAIGTLLLVLIVTTIAIAIRGEPAMALWSLVPPLPNIGFLLYTWFAVALWYLPIWSWCLLASAWARRAPFLWAVVPVVALGVLEYQFFGTREIGELLLTRVIGVYSEAIAMSGEFMSGAGEYETLTAVGLAQLMTPGRFFASAHLWGGLVATVAMFAATVWVRRFREAS